MKNNDLAQKVTREGATEPPFSGKYNDYNKDGIYSCINCNTKLFSSIHKFKSNSGWPSFYDVENDDAILEVLSELLVELKELNNLKKIESLEKKLINNLDENSYSELIKLKNQLNRE